MKDANTCRERWLVLIVAVFLALLTPVSYAVVKNVTVVDSNGNALGNTKVTIVFPDGTEQEEETDDKGMLIFDFPGDGDYKLVYPGGSMGVTVGGGVPTWAWVLGGAAVAGGVAVAVDDDDDDSSSSSDPSGSSGCTAGMYSVSTSVISNPDDHPDVFSSTWDVGCSPGGIFIDKISSSGNAISFSCSDANSCNESGASCTFLGSFNTTCSLTSSFGSSGWSGTMSGGDDGGLPDTNMDGMNQPIQVNFTGTLQ